MGEGERAARVASRSNPPRPVLFHPREPSRRGRNKRWGSSAAKEMARGGSARKVEAGNRARGADAHRSRGGKETEPTAAVAAAIKIPGPIAAGRTAAFQRRAPSSVQRTWLLVGSYGSIIVRASFFSCPPPSSPTTSPLDGREVEEQVAVREEGSSSVGGSSDPSQVRLLEKPPMLPFSRRWCRFLRRLREGGEGCVGWPSPALSFGRHQPPHLFPVARKRSAAPNWEIFVPLWPACVCFCT